MSMRACLCVCVVRREISGVARVQLALNVADVDAAVAFYSRLFGTEPAKRRPGYANFAVAEPPLKLILIENESGAGTLNHLGVEVESTADVAATADRLAREGLPTAAEDGVPCCYAVQDKVWVDGPDGEPWEIYTVLADVEMPAGRLRTATPDAGADALCCAGAPESAARCC
jgi:catechol 2,3-dioxygenase-like lactoylglutathione lyase family enzyme